MVLSGPTLYLPVLNHICPSTALSVVHGGNNELWVTGLLRARLMAEPDTSVDLKTVQHHQYITISICLPLESEHLDDK